jgi:hypothetical protein
LWDCKLRKCLPAFEGLKTFIIDEVLTMTRVSKKFKQIVLGCGIDVRQITNIQDF